MSLCLDYSKGDMEIAKYKYFYDNFANIKSTEETDEHVKIFNNRSYFDLWMACSINYYNDVWVATKDDDCAEEQLRFVLSNAKKLEDN